MTNIAELEAAVAAAQAAHDEIFEAVAADHGNRVKAATDLVARCVTGFNDLMRQRRRHEAAGDVEGMRLGDQRLAKAREALNDAQKGLHLAKQESAAARTAGRDERLLASQQTLRAAHQALEDARRDDVRARLDAAVTPELRSAVAELSAASHDHIKVIRTVLTAVGLDHRLV